MYSGSSSWSTRAATLLFLLCLPASSLSARPAGEKGGSGAVKVTVDRRAYSPGTPVQIQIDNRLGVPIALPGCATYAIEQFAGDDFVPLAPKRCAWEMEAVVLAKGARTLEYQPSHERQGIYRAVVTYGVGCRPGVALSSAQCDRFDTAYSSPFTVLQATEK